MKNKPILTFTFALVILLMGFVSAWGPSSPYWDKGASQPSPLNLYQGEEKTVALNIQNMIGDKDITVKAEIKQGSDIASLEKDTYTVKLGTSEDAILKVNAPSVIGTYKIEIEFKEVTSGGTGGVATGTSQTISFDVIVSEKPKETPKIKTSTWIITAIILLLIILIIIVTLIKRRK